jgi:two-component system cell cycle response regulator
VSHKLRETTLKRGPRADDASLVADLRSHLTRDGIRRPARLTSDQDVHSPRRRRAVRIAFVVWLALFAAYAAHVLLEVGDALFMARFVYNPCLLLAGALCTWRGVAVRRERMVWLLFGAALLLWGIGNVYWTAVLMSMEVPPYPSISDAFWLAVYLPAYAAVGLLLRSRVATFASHVWLDGLIAALVVAGLGVTVVFDAVLDATSGSFSAVATNLAYPLGDILLLALIVGVAGLAGRLDRTWLLLAVGLALFSVTDSLYLYQVSTETYTGGLIDLGWPLALGVVAAAAWVPVRTRRAERAEGWPVFAVPAVFALLGIGIETYDHFRRVNVLALALVSLALVLVIVRLGLTFGDHLLVLRQIRGEVVTDGLTGLGNRRALLADLDAAFEADGTPHVLALFDLDGFKSYNDNFGHPAGDALLTRLGQKLRRGIGPNGQTYRLGGDEFCLLVPFDEAGARPLVETALDALHESGERFSVKASVGSAELPREARTASDVIRLADNRMYEQKRSRPSAGKQIRLALLSALNERDPQLDSHVHSVATVAVEIGRGFGLQPEELEELRAGAELHDIGKVAIPDAVLHKPGPLDAEELAFILRHTLIGERIVGTVPALEGVARIVRWSHERWDGTGYPDRLAGGDIPLAARIIGTCDAFDAMTTDRPYRPAMPVAAALRELERCAGTQFDPAVVAAFAAAFETVQARRDSARAA